MTLYDLNPVSSFWSTAQELGFMNSPLEGYKSVIHKLILNNVLRMGEGLKLHEVFGLKFRVLLEPFSVKCRKTKPNQ